MWNNLVSLVEHAAVAGLAVALTYLAEHVTAADFGAYGPAVVGALSILVAVVKNLAGTNDVPPAGK